MNNWKIAFWICLVALLMIIAFSIYTINDRDVAIIRLRNEFTNSDYDKHEMMFIINHQDFMKEGVMAHMLRFENYGDQDKGDTLELKTVNLIFKDGKLEKVVEQW